MDSRGVGLVVLLSLTAMSLLLIDYNIPSDPISSTTASAQSRAIASSVFSPDIRVHLTTVRNSTISIKIDGPYSVRPVASQLELARGSRLALANVTRSQKGIRIGQQEYPATRLEIIPTASPAIWIDEHQYRGRVRLLARPGGALMVVNVLPLEEYLASVVDSEMPASFPKSARRAQAIVARTYALDQMQHRARSVHFDLYSSTRSQKYLGVKYRARYGKLLAGETQAGRQAVVDTAGIVCIHNKRIFRTYFSAVCGGRTTDGRNVFSDAAQPLASVPCDWCREARRYRWTTALSKAEINGALADHFKVGRQQGGQVRAIPTSFSNPGDAIATFEFNQGRQKRNVTPVTLRRLFPSKLHSPRFTISDDGDEVTITGRGHGHGVGLCQWGARGLAKNGKTCFEILAYYYPGSSVVRLIR